MAGLEIVWCHSHFSVCVRCVVKALCLPSLQLYFKYMWIEVHLTFSRLFSKFVSVYFIILSSSEQVFSEKNILKENFPCTFCQISFSTCFFRLLKQTGLICLSRTAMARDSPQATQLWRRKAVLWWAQFELDAVSSSSLTLLLLSPSPTVRMHSSPQCTAAVGCISF